MKINATIARQALRGNRERNVTPQREQYLCAATPCAMCRAPCGAAMALLPWGISRAAIMQAHSVRIH